MFFDRSYHGLGLLDRGLYSLNTLLLEIPQGSQAALRHPPQDSRFVGIANWKLLSRGIPRKDAGVSKSQAHRLLHDKLVGLFQALLPQRRICPSDVGMIPNLRRRIVLLRDKHPCYNALGQIRLHRPGVEMLD